MNVTTIGPRGAEAGFFSSIFGNATPPDSLASRAAAQRAAHARPTDPSARDIGWSGANLLKGNASEGVRKFLADAKDAGRAWTTAKNADLWMLRFAYESHKPMEAWIDKKPANGKLEINVVTSPSWHVGSNSSEKQASAKKFALSNSYHAEVIYPDGTREHKTFKVNGKNPEWASISPTIEIDLNKHKGDIRVRGWADGSAGVGGYIEARETIIHN